LTWGNLGQRGSFCARIRGVGRPRSGRRPAMKPMRALCCQVHPRGRPLPSVSPGCIRDGRAGSSCCAGPPARPLRRDRPLAAGRPTSAERVEEALSCTLIASARADIRNETLHRSPPPAWIRGPAAGHGKADWKRYLRQRRGNRCRFGKDRSHRDVNPSMTVIIGFLGSHV
jgi:hypothetical protein